MRGIVLTTVLIGLCGTAHGTEIVTPGEIATVHAGQMHNPKVSEAARLAAAEKAAAEISAMMTETYAGMAEAAKHWTVGEPVTPQPDLVDITNLIQGH